MLLITALLFVFASTMLIVVLPSLHIADLSNGYQPADSSQIAADSTQATPSSRQRLYLIFMIPGMAAVNALVAYLSYYRHVRNVYYRMECCEMENATLVAAGKAVVRLLMAADDAHRQACHEALPAGAQDREPLSSSLFASHSSISSGSFVLAAMPSLQFATSATELQEHNRKADVSRAACPTPWLSDVAEYVDTVDAMLADAAQLRRRVARAILQQWEASKHHLGALEASLGSGSPSSPSGTTPADINRLTLSSVEGHIDVLRDISEGHGSDVVNATLEATYAVVSPSRRASDPQQATKALQGRSVPCLQRTEEVTVAADPRVQNQPYTTTSPLPARSSDKRRLRRGNSRVIFTRSRSAGASREPLHSR